MLKSVWILSLSLAALWAGCSDDDDDDALVCGAGTHRVGDECVPDANDDDDGHANDDDISDDDDVGPNDDDDATDPQRECMEGTVEIDGDCHPETVCGAGTVASQGECIPTFPKVVCGPNTRLVDGVCVGSDEPYDPDLPDLTGRWRFFSPSNSLEVITLCIYNDFEIDLYIPEWLDIEKDGEGAYVFSYLPLNLYESDGSDPDWIHPVGGNVTSDNRVTALASKGYVDHRGDAFYLLGTTSGTYDPDKDELTLASWILVQGPGDYSEVCLMEMRSRYERE